MDSTDFAFSDCQWFAPSKRTMTYECAKAITFSDHISFRIVRNLGGILYFDWACIYSISSLPFGLFAARFFELLASTVLLK